MGASRDSVASHQRFKKKYGLPFRLIADTESKLHAAVGVKGRATLLLNADGAVLKAWPKVSVAGHVEDVYASLP